MKESERLTDGQIVSFQNEWLVAYKTAGANQILLTFADYMHIYNNAMTPADVLGNDNLLNHSIGVIGEIAENLEAYIGGFARKKDVIATNRRIEEFRT